MKNIESILRGIGQVILQNNPFSGLLFLIGIFFNSWILGLAALSGALISTLTAHFLKYSKENIENGLYGFNGTLCGIALCFFYDISLVSILALIVASIISTPIFFYFKRVLPPYTAPFILSTWLVMLLMKYIFKVQIIDGEVVHTVLEFLQASFNSFGQIMFQENWLTGLFFLLGIMLNSKSTALYAMYAAVLSILIGLLISQPISNINAGIMGYNAILCIIALEDERWTTMLWGTLAVLLSVFINILLSKMNIITLTAAFVLSTWLVLMLKKMIYRITGARSTLMSLSK